MIASSPHGQDTAVGPPGIPVPCLCEGSGRTARRERPGAGASTADGPSPGGTTRLTSPRNGADAEDIGLNDAGWVTLWHLT